MCFNNAVGNEEGHSVLKMAPVETVVLERSSSQRSTGFGINYEKMRNGKFVVKSTMEGKKFSSCFTFYILIVLQQLATPTVATAKLI